MVWCWVALAVISSTQRIKCLYQDLFGTPLRMIRTTAFGSRNCRSGLGRQLGTLGHV